MSDSASSSAAPSSTGSPSAAPSAANAAIRVTCPICPQACRLTEGQLGHCGARAARAGQVVPTNYGQASALALDPIEKKPLARFHPGSMILSYGSYGCNLSCPFCQNASIAQVSTPATAEAGGGATGHADVRTVGQNSSPAAPQLPPTHAISPEELMEKALDLRSRGNIGIAYTYNEPLVGYEFVLDSARQAHQAGLLNVLVSNGYINARPLKHLLPHLDAANIDLKGFTQRFYDLVGAPLGLETVKRTITLMAPALHLEVTTLIIPGHNDSPEEIAALATWLAAVDPGIALHLTRFHPAHRMLDLAPTPRQTIHRLVAVAQRSGLAHVFAG
ncbi:MAG: radical SAM protein, partial [Coriobacteriales bacterium]|nr:radical SAM protein [Coriobacteriales bacterium]